ncbi:hypothetical protein [uncultured Polaribacter sp.]|uniref:hypothetical protein n=1 Tax=uncultured Polaribacter sp. TaxID=174711 RepID=UPI00259B5450|nr:hypothetical protein [uncultured Polaribacter sp.]
MADKKITELTGVSSLTGDENLVVVQSSSTKKATVNDIINYLVPTHITVSSGETVNLSDSQYADIKLVKLTWSGASGNMTLNLPSASSNTNRAIRFISNGGFDTNTRVYLTPIGGDTLDGSTNYYEINKEYEGIYVWSDGSEWFIIQKKA